METRSSSGKNLYESDTRSSYSQQSSSSSYQMQQSSSSATGARPKQSTSRQQPVDKDTPEYRQKREKNNEAVKQSRIKFAKNFEDTSRRVQELQRTNAHLKEKLKTNKIEWKVCVELHEKGIGKVPPQLYPQNQSE